MKKIVLMMVLGLVASFNAQAKTLNYDAATAADVLTNCASFSGPLTQDGRWIGSVDVEEKVISTDVREYKYSFQSKQRMGFTGSENAPYLLEVTRSVDSSNVAADAPARVTHRCNLVITN